MAELMTEDVYAEFGFVKPSQVPKAEVDRMWEKAQELIRSMVSPGMGWTEDDRRYIGKVHQSFLEGTSDWVLPHLRIAHFWTVLRLRKKISDEVWAVVSPAGSREYALLMALWYQNNFPKVVLEGSYASALMATKLTEEVKDLLVPPWDGFMVEIKDTPLTLQTKRGDIVPLPHIFVNTRHSDGWSLTALAGNWDVLGLGSLHPSKLGLNDVERVELFLNSFERNMSDLESSSLSLAGFDPNEAQKFVEANARLVVLAQRLVAGVCLAMSDPRKVKQQKPVYRASIKHKSRRGLPLVRVFEVGSPISVDCRPMVRDFLEGRKASVQNVQVLVRGHWRAQPHGPGNQLRKVVHIEPYWRGPEDAPIQVRPHVVKAT